MGALKNGLQATTERFASPLNCSPHFENYCSAFEENQLFGADHNAYSTKWTGSSQARPEWNDAKTDKAVRWAIASTDTSETVLTAFVLPWHTNKGAAYTKWLCHPAVQEIKTISRRYIKLEQPLHWSTGVQLCREETKRDVKFLVVAHEAGLRTYVQQSALASGLAEVAQQCLADQQDQDLEAAAHQQHIASTGKPQQHVSLHQIEQS